MAASKVWPYAVLCASRYLRDSAAAHDLMDHAVENVAGYVSRSEGDITVERLIWRLRRVLNRAAKQAARKTQPETSVGLSVDLGSSAVPSLTQPPDAEELVFVKEILQMLLPQTQQLIRWRSMGYSWKRIAKHLQIDRKTLCRAYERDIRAVLDLLASSGKQS